MNWNEIISKLRALTAGYRNTLGDIHFRDAETVSENLRSLAETGYKELMSSISTMQNFALSEDAVPQIQTASLLQIILLEIARKERAQLSKEQHTWGLFEAKIAILGKEDSIPELEKVLKEKYQIATDDLTQIITLEKLSSVLTSDSDTPILDILMDGKQFTIEEASEDLKEPADDKLQDALNRNIHPELDDFNLQKEDDQPDLQQVNPLPKNNDPIEMNELGGKKIWDPVPPEPIIAIPEGDTVTEDLIKKALYNLTVQIEIEKNLATKDGARAITDDDREINKINGIAENKKEVLENVKRAIEEAYVTNYIKDEKNPNPLQAIHKKEPYYSSGTVKDFNYNHLANLLLDRGTYIFEVKPSDLVKVAQINQEKHGLLPDRKPPETIFPNTSDDLIDRALYTVKHKLKEIEKIIKDNTNSDGVETSNQATNFASGSRKKMNRFIGEISLRAQKSLTDLQAAIIRIRMGMTNYMPGNIDFSALAMMDVITSKNSKKYEDLYAADTVNMKEGQKISNVCEQLLKDNNAALSTINANMTPALLLQFASEKDYRTILEIGKTSSEAGPDPQDLNSEELPNIEKIRELLNKDPQSEANISRDNNITHNLTNLKTNEQVLQSGSDLGTDTVYDLTPSQILKISTMLKLKASDYLKKMRTELDKGEDLRNPRKYDLELTNVGAKAYLYEDAAYAYNQLAGALDSLALNNDKPFKQFLKSNSVTHIYLASLMDNGGYNNSDLMNELRENRSRLDGAIKYSGGCQSIVKALSSKSKLWDWYEHAKTSDIQKTLDNAYTKPESELSDGINRIEDFVSICRLSWGVYGSFRPTKDMSAMATSALYTLAYSAQYVGNADSWKKWVSRDTLKCLMLSQLILVEEQAYFRGIKPLSKEKKLIGKYTGFLYSGGLNKALEEFEKEHGNRVDNLYEKLCSNKNSSLRKKLTGLKRAINTHPMAEFFFSDGMYPDPERKDKPVLPIKTAGTLCEAAIADFDLSRNRFDNLEYIETSDDPELYREKILDDIRRSIYIARNGEGKENVDISLQKEMMDYINSINDQKFLRVLMFDSKNTWGISSWKHKINEHDRKWIAGLKYSDKRLKAYFDAIKRCPGYDAKRSQSVEPQAGGKLKLNYTSEKPFSAKVEYRNLSSDEKLQRKYSSNMLVYQAPKYRKIYDNIINRLQTLNSITQKELSVKKNRNERKIELLKTAMSAYEKMGQLAAEGKGSKIWTDIGEKCRSGKTTEWETIFLCENILAEAADPNGPHPYTDRLKSAKSLSSIISELKDTEPFIILMREKAQLPYKESTDQDGMQMVLEDLSKDDGINFVNPAPEYTIPKFSESDTCEFGSSDPDDPSFDIEEYQRKDELTRPEMQTHITQSAGKEDLVNVVAYVNEIKRLNNRFDKSKHFYQHDSPAYTSLRSALKNFVNQNSNAETVKLGTFLKSLDPIMKQCQMYQLTHRNITSINADRMLRMKTVNYLQTLGEIIKRGIPMNTRYAQKAMLAAKIVNADAAEAYKDEKTRADAIHKMTHSNEFQSDVWGYQYNKMLDKATDKKIQKIREESGDNFKNWFEKTGYKTLTQEEVIKK